MASKDSSSTLCNITLEDSDLKKLQELDPNQSQGYRTYARINSPVLITYANELGQETSEMQPLTFQILVRYLQAGSSASKKAQKTLQSVQIYITSQTDLYFNFVSNCSQKNFEALKNKNQLNIRFSDLPNVLISMLRNVGSHEQGNQLVLRLCYEGTGKLVIFQATQYKKLELIQLCFNRSSIEKAHQSVIFRFNYQKSKLSMLQSSIGSIYDILAKKNPPLLQLIQATVGVNQ